MEKIKELLENRKFQIVVLIFCFIFSAICLLLFVSQVYSFIAQDNPPVKNNSNPLPTSPPPKDDFFRGIPKDSPMTLIFSFIGFFVSLSSGLIIFNYLFKNEKKKLKIKVVNEMLLPEEKLLIQLLEQNNGELTQRELVLKSNLNKLKVSRIVKRLESLNIIDKYAYGMTNNIKLKQIP